MQEEKGEEISRKEETGKQWRDDEERQEPMLMKWKYDKYFHQLELFQILVCLDLFFFFGGGEGFKNPKNICDHFSQNFRYIGTTLIFFHFFTHIAPSLDNPHTQTQKVKYGGGRSHLKICCDYRSSICHFVWGLRFNPEVSGSIQNKATKLSTRTHT